MSSEVIPHQQSLMRTGCGRTIAVSRFTPGALPTEVGPIVLDVSCEPYDRATVWAPLTPEEARRLAGLLLQHAAAVDNPAGPTDRTEVVSVHGDVHAITVRGHLLTIDQPVPDGGTDTGPTPVELLVAALAGCVAHYAAHYLDRHQLPHDGLRVTADHTMAADRPARVASVALRLTVPGLPPERTDALLAVVRRCTVHNTLELPPGISIAVEPQ